MAEEEEEDEEEEEEETEEEATDRIKMELAEKYDTEIEAVSLLQVHEIFFWSCIFSKHALVINVNNVTT